MKKTKAAKRSIWKSWYASDSGIKFCNLLIKFLTRNLQQLDIGYRKYLMEVVQILESDPEFREKLEKADDVDIYVSFSHKVLGKSRSGFCIRVYS